MASNLSSIGFEFATGEQFQATMLSLARDAVERLGCSAGDYAIWRSRTGAEIWFHLPVFGVEDDARDIVGLTPFFEGSSEVPIEIVQRLTRPDDNAFEGALVATVRADAELAYPIVLDAVDFAAHPDGALPYRCRARITGFARELRAYPDEAAFSKAHDMPGSVALAPCAFIPIGQLADGDAPGAPPASTALMTGRVEEHRELVNEVTGRIFHWLLLDSLGAKYDIVAGSDALQGEIVVGGTAEVGCVLFGRLLEE